MALSIVYWSNYVSGTSKLIKKSENAVNSEHVLKFVYDKESGHIEGVVQASMRDRSYRVKIDLDEYSEVTHSSCECPLGNYRCHHVAAALLFGYKRGSKTDVKCSWLSHPKSAMPTEVKTMEDLFPLRKPDYRALNREVTDSDRDFVHEELRKLGRFTGLQWLLSPEPPAQEPLIPCIEDVLMSNAYIDSSNKQVWLRRKMFLSPEKVEEVCLYTVGQRKNPSWSIVRKNRITASNFGPVLGAISRDRYPPSLQKRLLSAYNLSTVKSISYGISQEAAAVEMYCQLGAQVVETGIWLHECGVLGASPDGLVKVPPATEKINYQTDEASLLNPELLEVKCPYFARDMTVREAISSVKGFYLVCSKDGQLKLRGDHDYYHQIQGQLHISGKRCCDLVVMTKHGIEVVRIPKDDMWTPNINRLIEFFYNKFIPGLMC